MCCLIAHSPLPLTPAWPLGCIFKYVQHPPCCVPIAYFPIPPEILTDEGNSKNTITGKSVYGEKITEWVKYCVGFYFNSKIGYKENLMLSKTKVPPEGQRLKDDIIAFCKDHGADLVGLASAERWDEAGEVPPDFRPRSIWPPVRTVIVIGVEMPLPIVETTPSVLHMELYKTANRKLDTLAYDLTRHLNRMGHASFFFGRDVYASLKALKDQPMAAFSHVMAAKYAGLGTIGASHVFLTPEFGPRVRFVSVFTSVAIPPDTLVEKDLCIKCGLCALCCPKKAITMKKDHVIGGYDKMACLEIAEELTRRRIYPCGICIKVCPVGKDRLLYKQKDLRKKYLREAEALAANPEDPEYKPWTHIRKYGTHKGETDKASTTKSDQQKKGS